VVNELGAGAVLEAQYLKAPEKRAPGQRTAFVSITLKTARQANKALKEGLIIEGKKVFGRKDIQEARRCLKCQGFSNRHRAATCLQVHDTCALCGQMHRTSECPNPNGRYCVNCKVDSHFASSKNCPVFIAECEKISHHFPDNKYRFFPILDDPSTWELRHPPQNDALTLPAPLPQTAPVRNNTTTGGHPNRANVGRMQGSGAPQTQTQFSQNRTSGESQGRQCSQRSNQRFTPPPVRDNGWPRNGGAPAGIPLTQASNPQLTQTQTTLNSWINNAASPPPPRPPPQPPHAPNHLPTTATNVASPANTLPPHA
jgi:hypothetical protein